MSILEKLNDERIFYISSTPGAPILELTEACDDYFSCNLSKSELAELIKELKAIYHAMPETELSPTEGESRE